MSKANHKPLKMEDKIMNNEAIIKETISEPLSLVQEEANNAHVLKESCDWFIITTNREGLEHSYTKEQIIPELEKAIVYGSIQLDDRLDVFNKTEQGQWIETKAKLHDFYKTHFRLRTLYQPVWAHAMKGLKWGVTLGISIKALDTLITFALVDPLLAIFFIVVLAVFFFPRYGVIGAVILAIAITRNAGFSTFISGATTALMAALTATLTGAILGALPGMFIGGVTGFFRRNIIPRANDISTEPDYLILKAIILPLIGGSALICFYLLVVNPLLMGILK